MHRILVAVALTVSIATCALADYHGELSSSPGTGIDGSGIWVDPGWGGTSLSWDVSIPENGGPVLYSYTMSVPRGDISHFILGTCVNWGQDLWNLTLTDADGVHIMEESLEFGWFSPGSGNPYMPADIHGLKFDLADDTTFLALSFYSWHLPQWGDFYAKNGKAGGEGFNTAWNIGLDPNSQELDHYLAQIMVPGCTVNNVVTIISEPGALTLVLIGFHGVVFAAVRKIRKR